MSKSPSNLNGKDYKLCNGNVEYKMLTLENLDNPSVVPVLMNSEEENPTIISKAVPIGIQDNATFVLNLDTLENRKDLFSDENG